MRSARSRPVGSISTPTPRASSRCRISADRRDRSRRLSEREFAVFIQLARGQSVNSIAETLSLSPNTVGTHLYNIKQKLGAANQAELALIAVRNGLIEA